MFGEPEDVEGECNARLFLGDNFGDNHTTVRCPLSLGHEGEHTKRFARDGGEVTIVWVNDERVRCDHGCGQWEHAHAHDVACPKDAEGHQWSDCAFCHPGKEPWSCASCGRATYDEEDHKYHCQLKRESEG